MNIIKIMIPKACTVFLHDDDSVRQGLEIMRRYGYTAIPVIDKEGTYTGCVSEGDFLRHVLKTESTDLRHHEKYRISEILRRDFCPALNISATLEETTDAVLRQNFVPIVDDRGCLCGIITRRLFIAYLSNREVEPVSMGQMAKEAQ